MLAEGIVTALIAAISALGGAVVAHWGAAKMAARQETSEAQRERRALLRQQRAECLGWVLETRTRVEALMPRLSGQAVSPGSADKTAAVAARQAYAVALLDLAAARPLAKAFYQSTVRVQLALEKPNADNGEEMQAAASSWILCCEEMEECLASMAELEHG